MIKPKLQRDVILKDFWRDNERFADLFNAIVFNGRQIILPEQLTEADTDVSGIIDIKTVPESLSRFRDLIKKTAQGVDYILMAMENQMLTHYAMPLRVMLMDSLSYLKEYNQLRVLRKGEPLSGAEYLSGIRKDDRLHPVISIVLYYGETPWDGPFSLMDMMTGMPAAVADIFANYRMNLLQVIYSDGYVFHNPEVQMVFDISREIFRRNYDQIKRLYGTQTIENELLRVIAAITDSWELLDHPADHKEVSNMCTALEELKTEGKTEGKTEARREIALKLLSKGLSTDFIHDVTDLSIEEINALSDEHT